MPKAKTEKKKVKVVYFNCQYCNRGLKTTGARTNHEKNCLLNPANQEPKIKSQEIAKTIPPELQEKVQEAVSPKLPTFTEEEQEKLEKVSKFMRDQSSEDREIEGYDKSEKKLKGETKVIRASEILDNIKSGQKFSIQDSVAYSTLVNAQIQQQAAQQTQQINNLFIQEKLRKLDQPKEATSNKFQEQVLAMWLKNVVEAKEENDIEKFQKNYDSIKKMIDIVGEKSPMSEGFSQLGEIAKVYLPVIKEAFEKKQQRQEQTLSDLKLPPPQTQQNLNSDDSAGVEPVGLNSHREAGAPMLEAPSPNQANVNEEVAPQPQPISDEQYAKTHDLSSIDYYPENQETETHINQMLGIGKFKGLAPTTTQ